MFFKLNDLDQDDLDHFIVMGMMGHRSAPPSALWKNNSMISQILANQ
jgi:hypothetical protein